MSATPSKDVIELFKGKDKDILRLDIRFHRHPLPVPQIYAKNRLLCYLKLITVLYKFLMNGHPVFVFAPTIEKCEKLYEILDIFFLFGNFVHSKREKRNLIIETFRRGEYRYLVTTSVLERGVTVKDLQVIVFDADHKIYDKGTLIQIAGRAGRKKDAPEGEVIFISKRRTKEMEEACESIRESNKSLQDMLQRN